MKILFLLHSSGKSEGSSIAAISILNQLQKRGYELHIVCPEQGQIVDIFRDLGMSVSIIRYHTALYPKVPTLKSIFSWPIRFISQILLNIRAEVLLTRLVKIIHPDIIHTNVGVLRVGYYVSKRLNIPHVWHIRECYNSFPTLSFQKKLFAKNRYNIAITKSVKEFFELSERNTEIIYDGVFSQDYLPKTKNKKNYFLFVGRVIRLKGADWAVDAFLKVADVFPDVELWLAGNDTQPFAHELKQKIKQSPHVDRVCFLGQRSDIYDLMAQALAVLVPSEYEGFGFTTVEAMINNTLVIGRDTGGTKEQFDNGLHVVGDEIALRCNTVDDMAKHMLNVCDYSQKDYECIIQSAQYVVRQLYTIENSVTKIENIYKYLTR